MSSNELNKLLNIATNKNHINGTLIKHLKGTYSLLKSWGANEDLCSAGLYHALYGTSGFDNHLIHVNDRSQAKLILGNKIEKIIYTYCACDRNSFWPQIGVIQQPVFLNRFTNKMNLLNQEELEQFCELTVANEIDIAKNNHEFIKTYGQSLNDLFRRMKPYLSVKANKSMKVVFEK